MLDLNELNSRSLKNARLDAPVRIEEKTTDIESIVYVNSLLEDAGFSASLCTNEEALVEALMDINMSCAIVLSKLPNSSFTDADSVKITEYDEDKFEAILEFAAKFA